MAHIYLPIPAISGRKNRFWAPGNWKQERLETRAIGNVRGGRDFKRYLYITGREAELPVNSILSVRVNPIETVILKD